MKLLIYNGIPNDRRTWLILPACALLLVAFVCPVGWLLLRSFSEPSWGLQNYQVVFGSRVYRNVIWNTVVISGLVTVCTVIIGYPVAYTMVTAAERWRRLLIFVVLIPFWTSILVRTFAWLVLLQRNGLVNSVLIALGIIDEPITLVHNRAGVLIGMVQIMLPFLIFPLYSVMTSINRSYTQAAANLGAPPMQNFLRVYLPMSLPGLMTGATLVFVMSLGYFITPQILGGIGDVMVSQLIQQQIAQFGNWGVAGALALILMLGAVLILALVYRVIGLRGVGNY